ncbi:MAG: 6-phosphofructokinase [Nitrospinota bacterium]
MPSTPPSESGAWSPPQPSPYGAKEGPRAGPAKSFAVLTSGGDAPGMNAALRAVVRSAEYRGYGVLGVRRGFWGLLDDNMQPLTSLDVRGIIQRGGTILETSRCKPFRAPEDRAKAAVNLKARKGKGLIAIGGEGTFRGADALSREQRIPVVCVPGTIDNDIYGTDSTIGYDSAVNTALEAIDRIRDTAFSHERLFFVEVMGREAGYLALDVGIAGGAEEVFLPETWSDLQKFCGSIRDALSRGKRGFIVIVAEGDKLGGAQRIADAVKEELNLDSRVSVLGHIQRGGSPTARDRILASRLGVAAVEALIQGKDRVMVGVRGGEVVHVPLEKTFTKKRGIDSGLIRIVDLLKG